VSNGGQVFGGTAFRRHSLHLRQESKEDEMADNEPTRERETVVVEKRGSAGGTIAAIALLIAVLAVLAYFGLLPF
jgi:hypothetical protein